MAGEHETTNTPTVDDTTSTAAQVPVPAPEAKGDSPVPTELTARAQALGVDVSNFDGLAPEMISRVLSTIETSAGSIALKMVGDATKNSAPAEPSQPPPQDAPQPRMVPAVHDLKLDLPDPDKMDEGYGPEVKQLARAFKMLAEDYQREIGAVKQTLPRALQAVDTVYNAHVTQSFDEDLAEVISEVPTLASIYGTGPSRKLSTDSPAFKARVALHEARQRFVNSGIDPAIARRALAQAVGDQVTGKQTTATPRNEKGQFTPTQTVPPTHGSRTLPADQNPAAKDGKPRNELINEVAEGLARKWTGSK